MLPGRLNSVKKMFSNRIAFKKTTRLDKWKKFKNLPDHVDLSILALRMVPSIERARKLCVSGRVYVNGNKVFSNHKLKKYDLVKVAVRTVELKNKEFYKKRGPRFGRKYNSLRLGFLVDPQLKIYIKYKASVKPTGKKKV